MTLTRTRRCLWLLSGQVWSMHRAPCGRLIKRIHSARIERIQHNFIRFALQGLGWTAQPLPLYESRYLLLGLEVLSDRRKIAAALFVCVFYVGGSIPPASLICCVLRVTLAKDEEC
jgi:hypothetical protein